MKKLKAFWAEKITHDFMFSFFRIYYEPKNRFELYLLGISKKTKVHKSYELHSGKVKYPMWTKIGGVTYKVDKYKGYIIGSLRHFYSTKKRFKHIEDLNFKQLSQAIDLLAQSTIDIQEAKVSRLYFGFEVHTSLRGADIIRKNILMHKLKDFNRNKNYSTPKKELKLFEYDDFDFVVFANKKNSNKALFNLRFELRIKRSIKLKSFKIKSIFDLKNKAKLNLMFSEFIKRFDELTFIDDINYNQLSIKEQEKMRMYMNVNYWGNLPTNARGRKIKSRARKDFESIQIKYNLNSLNKEVRGSLEKRFQYLIKN